jgi:hypothetical protein
MYRFDMNRVSRTLCVLVAFAACERSASRSIDAAVAASVAAQVPTAPPPPSPSPPIGPLRVVSHGMVVLGKAVRGHGSARLEGCEVPQDEFGSYAEHGHFAASRAVDPSTVPADERAWLYRTVRLGDRGGLACVGAITELRVLGQLRGLGEYWPDDPGELADDILSRGNPVLVGVVVAPCAANAAWAVPAASLPPIVWDGLDGPPGSVELELTQSGACSTDRSYELAHGDTILASGDPPFELRSVIDLEHDGWPELVLADGWMYADGASHRYRRVRALSYPHDWYECIE